MGFVLYFKKLLLTVKNQIQHGGLDLKIVEIRFIFTYFLVAE